MRKASTLALIIGALILISPLALRADTVTENVTISFAGPVGPSVGEVLIPQFDPTLGTLTSFSVTLTGSATWDATVSNDKLTLYLSSTNASQTFTAGSIGNQPINIDLSGSNSPGALTSWTGTSVYNLDITDGATSFSDTAGGTLKGTLTYNYTPSPVPEPSSVLLLGAGLLGLAVLCGFKKRAAQRAS